MKRVQCTNLGCLVLSVLLFAAAGIAPVTTARAAENSIQACTSLPADASPDGGWSDAEGRAWQQLCERGHIDFNTGSEAVPDPRTPDDWTENRMLSAAFLNFVLFDKRAHRALRTHSIKFIGVWFPEEIDLEDRNITMPVIFQGSRFAKPVNMRRLSTSAYLSLKGSSFQGLDLGYATIMSPLDMTEASFGSGSSGIPAVDLSNAIIGNSRDRMGTRLDMSGATFTGALNMENIQVNGSLVMVGKAEFADVYLRNAQIGGNVDMTGARFIRDERHMGDAPMLHMGGASVQGQLSMNEVVTSHEDEVDLSGAAIAADVDLSGAAIAADVDLSGAEFDNQLNMNWARIGGNVFAKDTHFNGDLSLSHAIIEGSLFLERTSFAAKLDLTGVHVRGHLSLSEANSDAKASDNADGGVNVVNLRFARIGFNLNLNGANLPKVDLYGAHVANELQLGPPEGCNDCKDPPAPSAVEHIVLHNAKVGVINSDPELWPETTELNGFTYTNINDVENRAVALREKWFNANGNEDEDMLANHIHQPYNQLAGILHAAGLNEQAEDLLREASDRKRQKAWDEGDYIEWGGLTLLKHTVSYGYTRDAYARLLYYSIGLWLIGFGFVTWGLVGRSAGEPRRLPWPRRLVYSLDQMIPVISLQDWGPKDIALKPWAEAYFFFHKFIGFLLASILLGNLTGVIQ